MNKPISLSPSITVIVERSIANFSNQQGIHKIYSLLEAVEMLKNFIMVNNGEEFFMKEIENEFARFKSFKIKNYIEFRKFLDKSKKDIDESQIAYEIIKSKKSSVNAKLIQKISKKISPYQFELYFLFVLLLKMTGLQNKTISKELLRSPIESKIDKHTFDKSKKE